MNISTTITNKGYTILWNGKRFPVVYPHLVWKKMPTETTHILVDNLAYIQTSEMPYLLNEGQIEYNSGEPFLRPIYFKGELQHLPFACDIDHTNAFSALKKFLKIKYSFSQPMKLPSRSFRTEEKAIISLTFGKDSMISYALAQELELNPVGVAALEGGLPFENAHRQVLMKKFSKEFHTNVHAITDGTVDLCDAKYHNIKTQFGHANTLSGYALLLLPFNHYERARYTILGNEQSCNDYYITKQKFKAFPVYDQTALFTKQCDIITKLMTRGSVSTLSLIEPIHEMAIMKILHHRYPHYAKYQMSCFPDDHADGKTNRWCQHCSKCARMIMFAHALGIDMNTLGISHDMLDRGSLSYFSLFGAKGDVSFDISGCGRDEQLLAFYLAYKKGVRGYLIDLFKKRHYHEAKTREDELMKNFFSVHSMSTIPLHLRNPLKSILNEELQ